MSLSPSSKPAPAEACPEPPRLHLNWCSAQAARYACTRWHYARSLPPFKSVRVGVWERGQFVGCVIFGLGVNRYLSAPYGVSPREACELVRVAMTTHVAPVTQIIAIALKLLVRRCPKLRVVVSYADPSEGHHGGIYQGGNWFYTGLSQVPHPTYYINGKRTHYRDMCKRREQHPFGHLFPEVNAYEWTQRVVGAKIRIVAPVAKHRYVMPLDAAMRAKVAPWAKPFPKRESCERSRDSAAPGHQPGEGGAMPTRSLHRSSA